MTDKSQKVGPQGTQVFDLSEVESMLADELKKQSETSQGVPTLVGLSKPFSGKRFPLTQNAYHVGRKASSDILLDEPSVSSTHAKLVYAEGKWMVNNLLSSNGTYVNGDKVSSCDIYPGDRVRFGGVEFMFVLSDSEDDAEFTSNGMSTGAKVAIIGVLTIAALAAAAYFLL